MILEDRLLSDISLDDIRALVDDAVPEGSHLEYKEAPYGHSGHDRREMLRDVAALANSEGGYLIIGIREDYAGRAAELTPFGEPHTIAQAMRQCCLDGIRERVQGLEIAAYETGFNQGVLVIRVPPSRIRPHMVSLDKRTDFYCRYQTDRRAMTIGEIRDLMMRQLGFTAAEGFGSEVAVGVADEGGQLAEAIPPYAQVLTKQPVQRFLERYLVSEPWPQSLVIVSPFIGNVSAGRVRMQDVLAKAMASRTRVYVITREPTEGYHEAGIAMLEEYPLVEIRYNADVHAKLYLVWGREERDGFALISSGNLTQSGLLHNIELGIMISGRGYGREILREAYLWSAFELRTSTKSQLVKAAKLN